MISIIKKVTVFSLVLIGGVAISATNFVESIFDNKKESNFNNHTQSSDTFGVSIAYADVPGPEGPPEGPEACEGSPSPADDPNPTCDPPLF